MIVYLVSKDHQYTIREYLQYWAQDLKPQFSILAYENICSLSKRNGKVHLPRGTYIFSDLERLKPELKSLAGHLASAVVRNGNTVLNHPARVLCRFDLLKTLYEKGINSFDVYAIGEKPKRFPVFIRAISDHQGPATSLIYSQSDLDRAVGEVSVLGRSESELMIIEYCHVGDANGVFRKFGCQIVSDWIGADHIFFDTQWIIKHYKKPAHEELLEEERSFILDARNPHEEQIRRVFDIAKIEYGRLDYGWKDGKMEVWEINTNPQIAGATELVPPERMELKRHACGLLHTALSGLEALPTATWSAN